MEAESAMLRLGGKEMRSTAAAVNSGGLRDAAAWREEKVSRSDGGRHPLKSAAWARRCSTGAETRGEGGGGRACARPGRNEAYWAGRARGDDCGEEPTARRGSRRRN
ncbi:hypothetical protein E2562_010128 [Oryza meyeriana var. granulata]|uniref:DUF834 domain-containing protein n=1 Tax=Oryza meyeriana var. granulata TaxID=110450 RepID=A0A6G1EII4_9ORYZ|nr:hypothetical protein E2562_010128 [Oryza meyeriana var. granulata]